VFGSLTSAILSSNKEGRTARGRVREILFKTENLRWVDQDYTEFRRALAELEAAALIAQVPREVVVRYAWLAEVAHYTELNWRQTNPSAPERSLPLDLALLLDITIHLTVLPMWKSIFRGRRWKSSIWQIDQATKRVRKRHPDWSWQAPMLSPVRLSKEPGLAARILRSCPPLEKWNDQRRTRKMRAQIQASETE
jgi:hypothetical protein